MAYKYHCLNPIAQIGLDGFSADYSKTEDVNEAEAILVRSAAMHDMDLPSDLLAVARAGAGVNNIPLDKCAEKGIVVFNTPGANANAVKELVLAGMLIASRDIVGGIEWVRSDADDENLAKAAEKEKKKFAGTEILGKKLGIIGLGAIGVKVANAAIALGMEVYGYDPYLSVKAAWGLNSNVHHVSDVNDIYKLCDYITIHVPLLDSTKEMINKDAIAQMKDGVIILNFARDLLADENAVLDGIAAGKIRKYVSDFANPTTAGKDGVILLPHLGASTAEAEDNCAVMAVEEVRNFIENGNIINSVNYPNVDSGVCQTAARITICHKNVANMITKFTGIFGELGINISNMVNKSKGDFAYTLIDADSAATDDIVKKLNAIDDVIRVRVIK
ncbi:MAG: phosphoglycerate dehydrogenase [Lachnospiraceae bacterium]|nr:phosphoglycerate dehydrogenase [Lachnospiraceae bacterium]